MSSEKNTHNFPEETQDSNKNNNGHYHAPGGRSIFSVTVDPTAIEQEIDQAARALHSTVNTLLSSMQSSVFGSLDTLSREMSALERQSKAFLDDNNQPFPWTLWSDGPKKRYRITIEELPPLDSAPASKDKSHDGSPTGVEDFTIMQGKAGTADEGKTVITASVAPGLLDWLLFTTHEDSFFRRLGQGKSSPLARDYDVVGGTKISEVNEGELSTATETATATEQEGARKSLVPAIVEKVKKVGTSWEKDARHWWQRKGSSDDKDEEEGQHHHLVVGPYGRNEKEYYEDRHSRRWPRSRQWESSESFSQTTVTRPDGTVEKRTVTTVNGETETQVKIIHNDGSIEETVTRESSNGRGSKGRWGRHFDDHAVEDDDHQRDSVAAVVAEAIATEKAAEGKRNWPPKGWTRRQERDE
ncbi:hypothetical protein BGZ94_009248 [Podila epigama]|nr:hypothetical protein BGZ94_009248 [Podila epigama]